MTSIEFIKDKMKELINLFPNIKCSYEFQNFDNSHIIEVLPSGFYKQSHLFYNKSTNIDIEFIENFPFEGLFFIDDNDLFPIKNITYEVIGRDYNNTSRYTSNPETINVPALGTNPAFLSNLDNSYHSINMDEFEIKSLSEPVNNIYNSKLNNLNTLKSDISIIKDN